jgi:hypothetical protein
MERKYRVDTRTLYVIGSPAVPGVVKIGYASDARKRLLQLRCQSPVPLELLVTFENEGEEAETALHRHFADRRSHGEWFRFSEDEDPVELVDTFMRARIARQGQADWERERAACVAGEESWWPDPDGSGYLPAGSPAPPPYEELRAQAVASAIGTLARLREYEALPR